MKSLRSALLACGAIAFAASALAAEPEYTTIELEIDIAKTRERRMGEGRWLLRHLEVAQ